MVYHFCLFNSNKKGNNSLLRSISLSISNNGSSQSYAWLSVNSHAHTFRWYWYTETSRIEANLNDLYLKMLNSQNCSEYDRAVAPTLLFSVPSPTLPIPLTQPDCCTPLLFDDVAVSSSSQPTALRIRSRSPNIELSLCETTHPTHKKKHRNRSFHNCVLR